MLALGLKMLGVQDGTYQMFVLKTSGWQVSFWGRAAGECGLWNKWDPDWDRFIEEVVSLIDGPEGTKK